MIGIGMGSCDRQVVIPLIKRIGVIEGHQVGMGGGVGATNRRVGQCPAFAGVVASEHPYEAIVTRFGIAGKDGIDHVGVGRCHGHPGTVVATLGMGRSVPAGRADAERGAEIIRLKKFTALFSGIGFQEIENFRLGGMYLDIPTGTAVEIGPVGAPIRTSIKAEIAGHQHDLRVGRIDRDVIHIEIIYLQDNLPAIPAVGSFIQAPVIAGIYNLRINRVNADAVYCAHQGVSGYQVPIETAIQGFIDAPGFGAAKQKVWIERRLVNAIYIGLPGYAHLAGIGAVGFCGAEVTP